MAVEKDKKDIAIEINFHADAQNWEQRVKGELEAPHKWNETWGQLFSGGAPTSYPERTQYLQDELKNIPLERRKLPPKYGVGAPFVEIKAGQDFRRKKLFYEAEN